MIILRECLSYFANSESSSQALSVFNKANLLDLVVQCLERHSQNVELAISAGGLFFFNFFFLLKFFFNAHSCCVQVDLSAGTGTCLSVKLLT